MQGVCARTSRARRRRNGRFPIVGNLPFLYCRDNCRLCPECVSFFGRRVRHSASTPSEPNTEKVYHADCSNSIVYRQFLRKNFSTYRKMMEINCVSHPKRRSFTVFKPSNAPSKSGFRAPAEQRGKMRRNHLIARERRIDQNVRARAGSRRHAASIAVKLFSQTVKFGGSEVMKNAPKALTKAGQNG